MRDRFAARMTMPRTMTTRIVAPFLFAIVVGSGHPTPAPAATGDPQLKTDHEWYPGELSCSTFERLFRTQAELYRRVTGREVTSDEDKALAAWYWRNLHYWHGEEGQIDCFSGNPGGDKGREYWTGLFANGFGLCGTTHAQWCVEMDTLLGHCRSRVAGVEGHNSFEVLLRGGTYRDGRWALLDHDISTVIYGDDGVRLLSLREIVPNVKELADPAHKSERQHGWRIAGLHDDDARATYTRLDSVEYLAGYAGAPPIQHLRSGESVRRYLRPGLEDGKTFVFWGRNDRAALPGPSRDRTWVGQPEKMYGSRSGTGTASRAYYANAVSTYTPDFARGGYRQGVIDESPGQVTFEFYTPYIIAATPPNDKVWGVYDAGTRNGLVIRGKADCNVWVSTDQGQSWDDAGPLTDGMDLTDRVKGCQQYFLRFGAAARDLAKAGLSWTTTCQANTATIPHLHGGANTITYLASGRGLLAAGPLAFQAEAHVVHGQLGTDTVTLELVAPRSAKPVHIDGASWQQSGNPPAPVKYRIDSSIDGGETWRPIVKDWAIDRGTPEPDEFWSQSFTWGGIALDRAKAGTPIRVRFSNSGGKAYRKVDAYLVYDVAEATPAEVTFAWTSNGAPKTASHTYAAAPADPSRAEDATWKFDAGPDVETRWVEIKSR